MNSCSTCGRELRPQAKFCGYCGTSAGKFSPKPQDIPVVSGPTSQRRPKPITLLVVTAVAVVAAAGVTTFALTRGTHTAQPDTTAPVLIPATTTQPQTSKEIPRTSVTSSQPIEEDLRRLTSQDSDVAENLVGHWVPQLSSKSLGLVVGATTYDYPAIMADFQSLHDRFPDAIMVNSSDFNNFSRKNFWVTLKASVFTTADAVNNWCDEQNFAREDCHASRLTHTGGPAGNSKPR